MRATQGQEQIFRRQVERIMASSEFIASRQLREFLVYISEAAFEGRTHLDQNEIAEKILQRSDFNPLDDASVRKLATGLRQRLDRYYESEGQADEVRIRLPLRSYVPLFEVRQQEPEPELEVSLEPEEADLVPPVEAPHRTAAPTRRGLVVAGGLTAIAALAGGAWWSRRAAAGSDRPTFLIRTRQGDMMHQRNDVAANGLLLGPAIGAMDEVTARLLFRPERATQQAGILVFGNADRYIKLGRQFFSRPQLEFGKEAGGHYAKPQGTFAYDPDGQTNDPIWLTIRRAQEEYRAFISSDGIRWRPFGNVLTISESMDGARAAIFAHNGRSDAPMAEARFDRLSVGLSFHNRPAGPADLTRFAGWTVPGSDTGGPLPVFDGECLEFDFVPGQATSGLEFLRAAPRGDWTFTTRLDFLSVHGSTAGLIVRGTKGRFRFIRWDLDGGSITAEHLGNRQVNRRDFEGAPPVVLRLTCRSGSLRYSFSRDDREFTDVPLEVSVDALGAKDLLVGLHTSTSSWKLTDPRQPARFYYVRHEVESLMPWTTANT